MLTAARVIETRNRRVLPGARRAAVLVPFIDDGDPRILLTRRTDTLSTHKGQVAFPGGKIDPEDEDEVAAALREAHEEVGLPRDSARILGKLDDFPTVGGEMIVTPVVARLPTLPPLTPNPAEVARIFTIPLAALRQRERWREKDVFFRGREWPVFYFDHDGETLWGLSAYITLHLLSMTSGGAPLEIPAR